MPVPIKDDVNKNGKAVTNSKNNNKKSTKMVNNKPESNKAESNNDSKDEPDKIKQLEIQITTEEERTATPEKPVFQVTPQQNSPATPVTTKHKYMEDQWSPLNKSGKKCYNIELLMKIKEDPLSKNNPNIPLLDTCNLIRTTPFPEPLTFNITSRPVIDLLPNYAKSPSGGSQTNVPKDQKKERRNMSQSGKGSFKVATPVSGSSHRQCISITLSHEEVTLNQSKNAWKPARFKQENVTEEDFKTEELYKKFRGILNKLTPQKFDTLLERVKGLDINTEARLKGVIDLVFEKAIEEPNFSEAYAAMCNKLSMLKVPSDTTPDQCVNFRGLIINRCQNQFMTKTVDESIIKIEKEIGECTDPAKKKELQDQLVEENRRVRMRSVGNVRFIGELYKLKMLTAKIMVWCMIYLLDKSEEEKFECLCKLLTTIGEQVESEAKEQLEDIFKRMQDIVNHKSNKISNRVRFMIQDVIDLRRLNWVTRNVKDLKPKMMDQIQKEAEHQQRHIELMNAGPVDAFRREDGRSKRGGDGRRQGSNSLTDNQWKSPRTNYTVDTSKLKAVTQKNLSNIKLAPHKLAWNFGSGPKNTALTGSNPTISLTKNMYSMLETDQEDPIKEDTTLTYNGGGGRSTSRSNSGTRSTVAPKPVPEVIPIVPEVTPAVPAPQEPLPDPKKNGVKTLILEFLDNHNDEEFASDIKQSFPVQYHVALVSEIMNITLEKSAKDVQAIAKAMHHAISTGTISGEHFMTAMSEVLEFAPDLYIDIPMLYEYLGRFIATQIEKENLTFIQTFSISENIITSNHGHMLLKTIIGDLKDSVGPFGVVTKWQESGLELKQWMAEDQVRKWIKDHEFQFLEGGSASEDANKTLQSEPKQLVQLVNADETCDCIRVWVQDNLGVTLKEDQLQSLVQTICEHATFHTSATNA